jgi:hypothetical protein
VQGCAFAFTPFPSYKSIGFGAFVRSGQGRAFCARSSQFRDCGTKTLDGEDGRETLVGEGKGILVYFT